MDISKKISELIAYYIHLHPIKSANENFSKKIIPIFTNPRSGSTWLTDIIKTSGNITTVWEPLFKYNQYKINKFNPFAYPELHRTGFAWNQPIPENAEWEEARQFFTNLMQQKIINLKIYRFNDFKKLKSSNTLLFKFCFGNLMLPWFVNNFNVKPILFVRHPAAVVLSQLKRWGYTKSYQKYTIGNFRYNEIYKKYENIFRQVSSPEEYLAAEWALTNIYPVKHKFNNKKWLTVTYENMLISPEKELDRVSDFLDIKLSDNIIEQIKLPSFTTDMKKDFRQEKQLNKWKTELSTKQQKMIFNIIEKFEVDFYSKEELLPVNEIIYGK